jgi:hypothetical protein
MAIVSARDRCARARNLTRLQSSNCMKYLRMIRKFIWCWICKRQLCSCLVDEFSTRASAELKVASCLMRSWHCSITLRRAQHEVR